MSESRPLVSAVIPAYNREKHLPLAVRSVFLQDYEPIEIIIVDDASTDRTPDVVKEMNDPRIKYVRHEKNLGGSASRNTGVAHARGEYVAFLDSDDEWLPGKIRRQVDRLERLGESYGLVFTGFNILDAERRLLRRYIPVGAINFRYKLLTENTVGTTSTVMVRRELIGKAGGFDPQMKSCQDWDFYLRLSRICDFASIDEPLVNYHQLQAPNRISNSKNSVVQGHRRIQEKFGKDIGELPPLVKLKHLNNFSHIYINHGALALSLKMLGKAMWVSGDPYNLVRMGKRTADYISSRVRKG